MKQLIIGGFWAALLGVSCAGGTETENPATLEDFSSSACKSRAADPGQQALVVASDAEGLQCVEWTKNGDKTLTIRLLNFPEPCGDNYLGTAKAATDGTLELAVHKASCDVFRCGTCVFDFEYALTGVDTGRELSIHLGSAICATEPTMFTDEITLPVDQQDSGVACRYLGRSAVEQYGRGRGTCGERNLPCGTCDGTDTQTCSSGLTCTEVDDNDSRCLASCETDADCAGGLTTCQDGLCWSSAGW
jgi:hypothetical protein